MVEAGSKLVTSVIQLKTVGNKVVTAGNRVKSY